MLKWYMDNILKTYSTFLASETLLPFSRNSFQQLCVCMSSVVQLCPTLWDPTDCSRTITGSSVHGIFQARILEWAAISYSRGPSRPKDRTCISWVSCTVRQILYHCTTWESDPSFLEFGKQPKVVGWMTQPTDEHR